MTLCIPFLMFQGQAQEAIEHYLKVFPDAELLEIVHHPEGTEIYDPAPPASAEDLDDAVAVDLAEVDLPEDTEAGEASHAAAESEPGDTGDLPEPTQPDSGEPESTETTLITVEHAEDASDPDEVPIAPVPLVATAQLKIGGQVLMIQDSLMKHEFGFTPSISVAVVVDSTAEFHQIVDSLAPGGEFLMEPGDYDFAANFAWIKDRFGMSWQVNQPLGQPEPTAQAEAPVWG
ncbi:VOC family protein [Nesterenkonia sp. E16_7]|uniref:VOC family protein n=1 Tax=unclassified Nesterenkonia TaxID=2629769 RepID=UPI001A9353C1|nr:MULTISPECIES: VOC family protein [unclassified Nesterenkonia]MBO0594043.1 VOC family protein [Nesterenkonia sp. E16_10]MBO0597489.1 VOC family protein [Nesterenkonia sp. E16_7]